MSGLKKTVSKTARKAGNVGEKVTNKATGGALKSNYPEKVKKDNEKTKKGFFKFMTTRVRIDDEKGK